jgi:serine/threonine protein kinase
LRKHGAAGEEGVGDAADLTYATYVKYTNQIAEAVEGLHRLNVARCDLSLRSILLTSSDDIRLSDLGTPGCEG